MTARALLVCAWLAIGANAARGDDGKTILGTWLLVSLESDGTPLLPVPIKGRISFIIGERTLTMDSDLSSQEADYLIRPKANPSQLDITFRSARRPPQMLPATDGFKGIYSLDGDNLKFCVAGTAPRPADFHTKPQAPLVTFIFKREDAVVTEKRIAAKKKELDSLQGTWRMEANGKFAEAKLIILNDTMVWESGGTKTQPVKFRIDPLATPKIIDTLFEGYTGKAIYELKDDTLRICGGKAGIDVRPTDFTAGAQMTILKREKR